MIIAKLTDAYRYAGLHPLLARLFHYVSRHDLSALPEGRTELLGDRLFVNMSRPALRPQAEQKLEAHRLYIDVHFPLSGPERIGWSPIGSLGPAASPYDPEADCALFAPPAQTYFDLLPGEFCIVFPEDAHAPIIGEGILRKAVAKVRL